MFMLVEFFAESLCKVLSFFGIVVFNIPTVHLIMILKDCVIMPLFYTMTVTIRKRSSFYSCKGSHKFLSSC